MSKLVFGSDPEVFLGYKKDGNLFVMPPAFFRVNGIVPYMENGRHPVFDMDKENGITTVEDGVAFEFAVKPSTKWEEVFDRISLGKERLLKYIASQTNEVEQEVFSVPTINYEVDRWSKENDEFQNCLIFGCDQDFDAWNHNKAGKVVDAKLHPYRYGGGHIHISGSKLIGDEPILAIQCLTLTLGLAAVANSKVPNLEKDRTFLYGQPGKYRQQKYGQQFENIPYTEIGIEYRTPSNSWTNSFEHAKEVFKWAEIGITVLLEQGLGVKLIKKLSADAKKAILGCDQKMAFEILNYVEEKV